MLHQKWNTRSRGISHHDFCVRFTEHSLEARTSKKLNLEPRQAIDQEARIPISLRVCKLHGTDDQPLTGLLKKSKNEFHFQMNNASSSLPLHQPATHELYRFQARHNLPIISPSPHLQYQTIIRDGEQTGNFRNDCPFKFHSVFPPSTHAYPRHQQTRYITRAIYTITTLETRIIPIPSPIFHHTLATFHSTFQPTSLLAPKTPHIRKPVKQRSNTNSTKRISPLENPKKPCTGTDKSYYYPGGEGKQAAYHNRRFPFSTSH